jgi:hypothetical protein
MTVFTELNRVKSLFKTANYFSADYEKLDNESKLFFQTQLFSILDPHRLIEINIDDVIKYNLELYWLYSSYHLGEHTKAKQILSRVNFESPVCETIRYIYQQDEKYNSARKSKGINISFIDFWGIKNIKNSFIVWAMSQRKDRTVNITTPDNADIIIFSSYTYMNRLEKYKNKYKIYWSSEQDVPEQNTYNLSITSINVKEDEKHIRYMPWLGCVIFPGLDDSFYGKEHIQVPLKKLYDPNFGCHKYTNDRIFKSSAIISNPVRSRIDFINELEVELGKGSMLKGGRVYSNRIECKETALKECISNVCFENAIVPGYITEKLFEAKVVGCIPIYSGHKSVCRDFNTNGFINIDQLNKNGEEEDVISIANILRNEEIVTAMMAEPLFSKPPDIMGKIRRINEAIKDCT